MLLKALKIAPLLLGLNSPTLEQPKLAQVEENINLTYSNYNQTQIYNNNLDNRTSLRYSSNVLDELSYLSVKSNLVIGNTTKKDNNNWNLQTCYTYIDNVLITPFIDFIIEIEPTAEGMKKLYDVITYINYPSSANNNNFFYNVDLYVSYNQNLEEVMTLPTFDLTDYLTPYKYRNYLIENFNATSKKTNVSGLCISSDNLLETYFSDYDYLWDNPIAISNRQKTYILIDQYIKTTGYINNSQYFLFTNLDNTKSLTIATNNENYTGQEMEVVDVGGLMFEVLTMPFTFISVAFNLTMFEGTPYQINISNLFLSIIALLIFGVIIKIIMGFKQ